MCHREPQYAAWRSSERNSRLAIWGQRHVGQLSVLLRGVYFFSLGSAGGGWNRLLSIFRASWWPPVAALLNH